jgi:hypothetical protein
MHVLMLEHAPVSRAPTFSLPTVVNLPANLETSVLPGEMQVLQALQVR